ncbi:hypothetical protein V1511DRAFT_495520 [Dipodascopsis uninucleata]
MSVPVSSAVRQKSARIATKAKRPGNLNSSSRGQGQIVRQQPTELYPGLNDFSDFLEAFPLDIIRHFTLLREVEAKCTSSSNLLATLIPQFLATPFSDPARTQMLTEVHQIISDLLPCFEEKIHVAGSASEAVARHMERLDEDFDRISKGGEIPESVIFGPANHPALIGDGGKTEETKTQTQASARSESRREAMAAKKAAQQQQQQQQQSKESLTPDKILSENHNDLVNSKKRSSANNSGGNNSHNNNSGGNGHNSNNNNINNGTNGHGNNLNSTNGVNGVDRADKPDKGNDSETTGPATKRRKTNAERRENGSATPVLGVSSAENSRAQSPVRSATPSNSSTPTGAAVTSAAAAAAAVAAAARRGGRTTVSRNSRRPVGPNSATGNDVSINDSESEPVYCYCQQISYGEMVGCDGPDCKREWFHLPCVGLSAPPKGQWFCNECAAKYKKTKSRRSDILN